MPRENGIHNIHIKFNGVHILGSPFRLKVGKEDADPAAVHAHGNGLGEVKTGTIFNIAHVLCTEVLWKNNGDSQRVAALAEKTRRCH